MTFVSCSAFAQTQFVQKTNGLYEFYLDRTNTSLFATDHARRVDNECLYPVAIVIPSLERHVISNNRFPYFKRMMLFKRKCRLCVFL